MEQNELWMFGVSSDFSKSILEQFNDYNVQKFGRANLDYSNFNSFIENKKAPNKVIFNANIEERTSIDILDYKFDNKELLSSFENFNDVFCFLVKLLKWLEHQETNITFCLITSSITQWPFKHKQNLSYSLLRSLGQTALMTCATENLKVIGISPGGLSSEKFEDYAKIIKQKIESDDTLKIYELYNGIEEVVNLSEYVNE